MARRPAVKQQEWRGAAVVEELLLLLLLLLLLRLEPWTWPWRERGAWEQGPLWSAQTLG